MSQQDMSRATIQTEVARHVWQSEVFKKKLFLSPHAALAEIGIKIAQDVEISIVEEHNKKMVLVLPANPVGAMQAFIEAISPTPPPGQPPPAMPETLMSCPKDTLTDCKIPMTHRDCEIRTFDSCPLQND